MAAAAFSNAGNLGSRSRTFFSARLPALSIKQSGHVRAQLRLTQSGPGVIVEATMTSPTRDTSAAAPEGQALQRLDERMQR
jgi:hypothetical protein